MAGLKNSMDLKDRFTLQYKLDIPVTDYMPKPSPIQSPNKDLLWAFHLCNLVAGILSYGVCAVTSSRHTLGCTLSGMAHFGLTVLLHWNLVESCWEDTSEIPGYGVGVLVWIWLEDLRVFIPKWNLSFMVLHLIRLLYGQIGNNCVSGYSFFLVLVCISLHYSSVEGGDSALLCFPKTCMIVWKSTCVFMEQSVLRFAAHILQSAWVTGYLCAVTFYKLNWHMTNKIYSKWTVHIQAAYMYKIKLFVY